MGDISQDIEFRINNFEILLAEQLTPLLRKEINHAIELHREALDNPNPYLKDLDALYDQFKKHWTKVYGDPISKAILSKDIILFYRYLVGKLLEDYTNEPYTINKWVLDQAKCLIEQEGHAGVKDGSNIGTAYPDHVIYPLEEMMLSRDYVEKKLRAVATREGRQGSDIQPFIDRCDWSNLATALTNDRDLVDKLFSQQPFNTNIFDKNSYKRILRGIDEIEREYCRHTREMSSAGKASNQTNGSLPNPQTSRSGFGWDIFGIGNVLGGSSLKFRHNTKKAE